MQDSPRPRHQQITVALTLALASVAAAVYLGAQVIPQFSDPSATLTTREVSNPLFLLVASVLLVRKAVRIWRGSRDNADPIG